MKVRAWLALALSLCLAVSLAGCGSNDTAVYVQSVSDLTGMGGIAAGDRFPGMVVSENVTEIKKDSEKTVKEVLVKEGDDVNKGDKLFEYDTEELQLSLEKKQLELEQLNASIESYRQQIKELEKEYGVTILSRGTDIKVSGDAEGVYNACKAIDALLSLVEKGEVINDQRVRYVMDLVRDGSSEQVAKIAGDVICITAKGRPLKPKTLGQKKYVESIRTNTVTLGIGPAGTGKTYLAVAMAVQAFKAHEINRIILPRPAVEAGEKLGFLPGDLAEKVNPYLRPLHDALLDMLGPQKMASLQETGIIEVAPLAFMRGRTLNDAFIILDEAQNTTREQMKMFLTRLGFGSRAAITGDITQIDLPAQGEDSASRSGLVHALHVLKGVKGVAFRHFTSADVVRHPLVGRIVQAYDDYEKLPSSHQ